ncbi:MAG: hypothetical protein QM504_02990 [Pseudomonadota bacterium]
MNTINNLPLVIDEEIELLEYVTAILHYKYHIFFISMMSASLMFGLTFLMTIKYESFVNLALVKVNELGAVSPDNRRAPEAVTLVEQDFITHSVYENYQDRIIARMRSRIFTIKFINDNSLLPIIFFKRWDKEKKQWKDDFKPDVILAAEIFKHQICSINRDNENNLMQVKVTLHSAQLATDIANKFVDDFNRFRRTADIDEANRKIKFLRNTLLKTDFVQIKKSLYRLIEAQLVIKMLANNKQQYVVEILDPAIVPLYKSSPASKKLSLLVFIGMAVLCVVTIIGNIVFKRMQVSIKAYKKQLKKTWELIPE